MIRALVFTTSLLCFLVSNAAGCVVSDSFGTIFFEETPRGTNAPIVAKITITQIVSEPVASYDARSNDPYRLFYVAIARVDQVLKGGFDRDSIMIVAPGGDCNLKLRTGATGMVAGSLEISAQGELQLILVSESAEQRRMQEFPPK